MAAPIPRAQPFLVAANWKMNLLGEPASAWLAAVLLGLSRVPAPAEVVVFPPFPWLERLARQLAQQPSSLSPLSVRLGGQDLHPADHGAYTGAVSGAMLRAAGCRDVLCGHSERRSGLGESDALVALKVEAAVRCGLRPVVCVGETEAERQAGQTEAVLLRQLSAVLSHLGPRSPADVVLAYEPVWAIGTGHTANPDQAEAAHRFLRGILGATFRGTLGAFRILYGGSVNRGNARELARRDAIDGFLVGSAGLDPAHFLDIIRCSSPDSPAP